MHALARTVILGVAESDAHAVANQLIARQLRQDGYAVVNLGVCTPLADFAAALRDSPHAVAVIIGSLNGHALEDMGALPALRAAGELSCPVILGGNLSVGSVKEAATLSRLRALGVDYILDDPGELAGVLDELASQREAAAAALP